MTIPRWSLRRRFEHDLAHVARPADPPDRAEPVTEADLDPLPEPARRYLRWMGVVGRPRVSAFRVRFRGQFRMRPGQRWMPYDAWQLNRIDPVTRVARMRVDAAGILPMFGSDTYIDHRGRMVGKLLGLVTVADGRGRELDLGELVTFVNDAVMLAPSMLLTPAAGWRPVDGSSFEVVFTDGANTVAARITVDQAGQPLTFRTDDRWYAGTDPPTRAPWSTPFERWIPLPDGRHIPSRASAVWHLPDGAFTYVRGAFDPATLVVEPSAPRVPATGRTGRLGGPSSTTHADR